MVINVDGFGGTRTIVNATNWSSQIHDASVQLALRLVRGAITYSTYTILTFRR